MRWIEIRRIWEDGTWDNEVVHSSLDEEAFDDSSLFEEAQTYVREHLMGAAKYRKVVDIQVVDLSPERRY